MSDEMQELVAELEVTKERKLMIDRDKKRLLVEHSLVLHRDSASVSDVKAMIAYLEREGMPAEATLRVTCDNDHTRLWANWKTEPGTPDE